MNDQIFHLVKISEIAIIYTITRLELLLSWWLHSQHFGRFILRPNLHVSFFFFFFFFVVVRNRDTIVR